jgi:hypothetical protein
MTSQQRNSSSASTINQSIFSVLFTEILVYSQMRVETISELEERLLDIGKDTGSRLYALMLLKGLTPNKRELKIIGILQFIASTFWKYVFGKNAGK